MLACAEQGGRGMSERTLQGFAAVVLLAIVLFTGAQAFGGTGAF